MKFKSSAPSLAILALSLICLLTSMKNLISGFRPLAVPALAQDMADDKLGDAKRPATLSAANMAWFGRPPATLTDPTNSGDNLAANFQLKGVSRSLDPAIAGAFIAKIGELEKYYRIGDALPDRAGSLLGVFADHVTIKNGSRVLILGFAGASGPTATKPAVAAAEKSPFFNLPPDLPPPAMKPVSKAELIRQFVSEPDKLLAQAGLASVTPGQKAGYRFTGGDTQGVFANAGILPGDVIRSVNGHAVGDAQADRLLLPVMGGAKAADFDVVRNGQHLPIHYIVP